VVCTGRRPPASWKRAQPRRIGSRRPQTSACPISLPHEEGAPTPTSAAKLVFRFHYFFMRKFWFAYLAKAIIVFPRRLLARWTRCSKRSPWCRPRK